MEKGETIKKGSIEQIKNCFWDYHYEDKEIEERISELKKGIVKDESFLIRIIENLEWYHLIDILPIVILLPLLTEERINKIRSKRRRENLANAKSILLGESLPFSRWDHINSERSRHGLLSKRWYSTK